MLTHHHQCKKETKIKTLIPVQRVESINPPFNLSEVISLSCVRYILVVCVYQNGVGLQVIFRGS